MDSANPTGYDYGSVARSPVAWHDFEDLKRLLGFTERDQQLLNRAGGLVGPRFEELIGHWFGQIGPWVHATFAGPDAERYGAVAGARFGRGIVDCFVRRVRLQEWLDYQHEDRPPPSPGREEQDRRRELRARCPPCGILLLSAEDAIRDRDSFLEGATNDDIAGMRAAWSRSLLLQIALWSRAYVPEDDW